MASNVSNILLNYTVQHTAQYETVFRGPLIEKLLANNRAGERTGYLHIDTDVQNSVRANMSHLQDYTADKFWASGSDSSTMNATHGQHYMSLAIKTVVTPSTSDLWGDWQRIQLKQGDTMFPEFVSKLFGDTLIIIKPYMAEYLEGAVDKQNSTNKEDWTFDWTTTSLSDVIPYAFGNEIRLQPDETTKDGYYVSYTTVHTDGTLMRISFTEQHKFWQDSDTAFANLVELQNASGDWEENLLQVAAPTPESTSPPSEDAHKNHGDWYILERTFDGVHNKIAARLNNSYVYGPPNNKTVTQALEIIDQKDFKANRNPVGLNTNDSTDKSMWTYDYEFLSTDIKKADPVAFTLAAEQNENEELSVEESLSNPLVIGSYNVELIRLSFKSSTELSNDKDDLCLEIMSGAVYYDVDLLSDLTPSHHTALMEASSLYKFGAYYKNVGENVTSVISSSVLSISPPLFDVPVRNHEQFFDGISDLMDALNTCAQKKWVMGLKGKIDNDNDYSVPDTSDF